MSYEQEKHFRCSVSRKELGSLVRAQLSLNWLVCPSQVPSHLTRRGPPPLLQIHRVWQTLNLETESVTRSFQVLVLCTSCWPLTQQALHPAEYKYLLVVGVYVFSFSSRNLTSVTTKPPENSSHNPLWVEYSSQVLLHTPPPPLMISFPVLIHWTPELKAVRMLLSLGKLQAWI